VPSGASVSAQRIAIDQLWPAVWVDHADVTQEERMDVRKSLLPLIAALAVFVLIGHGAPADAQCVTTNVSSGASPMFIVKTISNANTCTLTMFNNADCFPGGNYPPTIGMTRMSVRMLPLSATPFMGFSNPSCGWACDCGAVTSNASDGLPVELMEFEIEDDESSESADDEDDNSSSD